MWLLSNFLRPITRAISLRHNKANIRLGSGKASADKSHVSVTFLKTNGKKITVNGKVNKSLYDTVIDNNVDIDGFGACEGTLCCTTCHLILKEKDYNQVGEPSDEESDMLDLAHDQTPTSRLGCQVFLRKELDPMEVQVPPSLIDAREI